MATRTRPAAGDGPEAAAEPGKPRKASREARRQQFIDATIATIARNGYAKTTLTDVAASAGLSHGLVIFHFETKEKLFTETLLFLSAEYRDNWVTALEQAPKDAAHQLDALIRADFNDVICTPERLSAWSAFWGETQSRPLYQKECASNDLEYVNKIEELCAGLNEQGGYGLDSARTAKVFRVMLEGLWLDMITSEGKASRLDAMATAFECARAFFPAHFTIDGAL